MSASRIGNLSQPTNQTWVANLAIYTPFSLPFNYPVMRVWWYNGATITTTNVDMGIYTSDGTKIYSTGSTTQSGASALQYVTVSPDIMLYAGERYYLAWTCDNTTNRSNGITMGDAGGGRAYGLLQQSSALPLPATATFAAFDFSVFGPTYCGITRTTTGF